MSDYYDLYDYGEPDDWRLRAGHVLAADLTAAYDITLWPRQTDQPLIVDWQPPLEGSDLYLEAEDVVEGLDGALSSVGRASFTWYLYLPTPLMVNYVRMTIFQNRLSAAVTVRTFDRDRGLWRIVNATAQWPKNPPREGEPQGRGYNRFPIRFIDAVDAVEGYGFSLGFSLGFNA